MRTIDLKEAGKYVKFACRLALCGFVLTSVCKTKADSLGINDCTPAVYSGAVKAIMNSDMWSTDKERAIAVLKRDESAEYYSAIISIVTGRNMWSTDKIKLIEKLSNN